MTDHVPMPPALSEKTVSEKNCGSCTQCCRLLHVPELDKPAWVNCPNCALGVGCKIYSERPQSCRDFVCGWLSIPDMGPDLKPDRCHVMLYQSDAYTMVANVDPDWPEAWRAPNVISFLHRLARALGDTRIVLVRVENRFWRIVGDSIIPITS
jgi:hypothetical protein